MDLFQVRGGLASKMRGLPALSASSWSIFCWPLVSSCSSHWSSCLVWSGPTSLRRGWASGNPRSCHHWLCLCVDQTAEAVTSPSVPVLSVRPGSDRTTRSDRLTSGASLVLRSAHLPPPPPPPLSLSLSLSVSHLRRIADSQL
ncbi:hypothetical protein RRG08_003507 [Elysia crispata]|uniref:Uncharacterized protein n=1 Tax=Elysia crispata TaxID=231223 RepID=A0AAE0Y7H7_9GAST|nr:hypothetical protein RRG08_003507 [Elysia crispata]